MCTSLFNGFAESMKRLFTIVALLFFSLQPASAAGEMPLVYNNVAHCSWSQKYTPVLEAYLDKFLLGKNDGPSTEILQSKFTDLNTEKWIPWTTPELK